MVDGLAIYPVPIEDASPQVREVHAALRRVLEDRLAPPPDPTLAGLQRWTDEVFAAYIRDHSERVRTLQSLAGQLAREGGTDAFFGALVVALAYDDFHRTFEGIEPPTDLRDDEELARVFRDALAEGAFPLVRLAREAYGSCSERGASLPDSIRAWASRCAARAGELAAIQPPPPRPQSAPVEPIAWPSECAGEEHFTREPEAPPPDLSRAEAIALVTNEAIEGDDRTRVLDAVRARVDALVDSPLLPTSEVLDAERLRGERRVRPRSPVCGQPPPLAWVLTQRHPNLVVGEVLVDCFFGEGSAPCALRVRFRRAGAERGGELPSSLAAPMTNDRSADALVAAAERLAPGEPRDLLLGVLASGSGVEVRLRGAEEEDPWLRLRSLLNDQRERFAECLPEGVASFAASFDVSAVGTPSAVVVRPQSGGSDATAACVQRALEASRWPCSPERRARRVEVTICVGRRPER